MNFNFNKKQYSDDCGNYTRDKSNIMLFIDYIKEGVDCRDIKLLEVKEISSQNVFCSICLDNVDKSKVINFGTICNHKFCKECIISYKKNKNKPQTETVSFYPTKRQSTIRKKVSKRQIKHRIRCPICRCNTLIKKNSPDKLIYKTPLQINRYFNANSLGKIEDYNIKTYCNSNSTKHKCLNFAKLPLQYLNNGMIISFDKFIELYSERFRGLTFAIIGQNIFTAVVSNCGCISKYSLEIL